MSINKVLNRPMFRNKALKKGHLKTINAQFGQMVGETQTISQATNPRRLPMVIDQPKPPGMIGRGFRAIGQLPFLIGSDLTYNALERSDPEGRLSTPVKIGASGLAGLAANYGAARIAPSLMGLSLGPALVGYGIYAGLDNRIRAGIEERKRINAMSPKEREEFFRQNRLKATDYMSEGVTDQDLFGKFVPRPPKPKEPKEEIKLTGKPGSGRPGIQDRLTEADNESEVVKGTVDIDKVVKNNDPNPIIPKVIGAEDTVAEKRGPTETVTPVTAPIDENKKANQKVIQSETNDLDKPGKVKAADGTEVNSEVIRLARQYRKELMAGQKSQAKLVFLSNLASGLMSGTTTKGGLGGALEVFGKALGPAVNNYATIKLKENEMENEFMSDALELAQDEISARNDLLEGGSGLDFEKYGVIQFTDSQGNLRNMTGGMLKDGTYVIARPGEIDANGRQVFSPVAAGTFDRFLPGDYATTEQGETLRNLSGKYKALNLGQSTIKILQDAETQDKKFAGPVGRFNLVTTRLGDALNDLGISMFSTKEEGERYIESLKKGFKRDLITNGMTEKEAEKFLEQNFGSTDSIFKNTLKQLGIFKDQTDSANLERLAINETVLTYALANSLKDKDRLTQKDIQMAKELVNVFPLLRGQKQVIKSLEAVNETILADIKRLENDYQFAFGGDSSTIDKYRIQYGVATPGAAQNFELQNPFSGQSTQELLENF